MQLTKKEYFQKDKIQVTYIISEPKDNKSSFVETFFQAHDVEFGIGENMCKYDDTAVKWYEHYMDNCFNKNYTKIIKEIDFQVGSENKKMILEESCRIRSDFYTNKEYVIYTLSIYCNKILKDIKSYFNKEDINYENLCAKMEAIKNNMLSQTHPQKVTILVG